MLRSILTRSVKSITRTSRDEMRRETNDRSDVDRALRWLLQGLDAREVNDLFRYVGFLRECIEPMKCRIEPVKDKTDGRGAGEKQLESLLSMLRVQLPPVRAETALRIAKIIDDYRGPRYVSANAKTQVSHHVGIASSAGQKGRLLAAAVKSLQPQRIVELGTAYGVSSLFMGLSLQEMGRQGGPFINTLEGFEPQATLSRELLAKELGPVVQCFQGRADQVLADMARSAGPIDFVFHDAGHTYEDYVNDFKALEPQMASGSVLLLDDIRWDDPRYVDKPARTHEGWLAVATHPRVKRAVEIDRAIGVALLE